MVALRLDSVTYLPPHFQTPNPAPGSYIDFSEAHKAYLSTLNEKDATEENSTYYQPKFEAKYQRFSKEISEWIKGKEVDGETSR